VGSPVSTLSLAFIAVFDMSVKLVFAFKNLPFAGIHVRLVIGMVILMAYFVHL
jgi:hypothetical protein